ncbi:MAG: hypothetical protein JXA54_15020 [Candidatus Heimdallarchaeota archaeon]|nr:hypothetical protein [Candidatus Heimdallarchaeota archaeon]
MAKITGKYKTSANPKAVLEIKNGSNPEEYVFIIIIEGRQQEFTRKLTFDISRLSVTSNNLRISNKPDFSEITFFESPNNIDVTGLFTKI